MKKLASLWRKTRGHGGLKERKFHIPSQSSPTSAFRAKYDCIQASLEKIAGVNDLISGSIVTIEACSQFKVYVLLGANPLGK